MAIHSYNNSYRALKTNDEGLGGIVLSVASLRRALSPEVTTKSLLEESDKRPPLPFILQQIYKLRRQLEMTPIYLEDNLNKLEEYVDEIYYRACDLGYDIGVILEVPPERDPVPVILTSLEQQDPDMPIDWWEATTMEFAIIIGVRLGAKGWYSCAFSARLNMLEIGTGAARGRYLSYYPARGPDPGRTPPVQRDTQQLAKSDAGSDEDMEGQCQDAQSEPEKAAPLQVLPIIPGVPVGSQANAGLDSQPKTMQQM